MKAKNYKTIIKSYRSFFLGLMTCVVLSIGTFVLFVQIIEYESDRINIMADSYDQIHMRQIEIVEKVDSLCNYILMRGREDYVNQITLQRITSERKLQLNEKLNIMEPADVYLYKKLYPQINEFLITKESIRDISVEEDLMRNDLTRCIRDDEQALRLLTLSSITAN